jgi:hypothetical protein
MKYLPKTRPWYVAVASARAANWSNFFTQDTTENQVISYGVPLLSSNGTVMGVVAVTRLLSQFTKLLQKYQGRHGASYVMDSNNNLIATSRYATFYIIIIIMIIIIIILKLL